MRSDQVSCIQADVVAALAVGALPACEIAAVEAHIAICPSCRDEFQSIQAVTATFASWPADELMPSRSLWDRLRGRIAQESGSRPSQTELSEIEEPAWEEVAPGISCKVLARDTIDHRVSMLVRLAPGAQYPAHTHAGVEELHLLDGELYIEDRKLFPGDYNRAEPGTSDARVWSETGCTCVLITSLRDKLI